VRPRASREPVRNVCPVDTIGVADKFTDSLNFWPWETVLTYRLLGRQVEAKVVEIVFPADTNRMGAIFGCTLVA